MLTNACSPEPAELALELTGPAVADPQVFHGNCFAGWSVRVELRVRETRGAAVLLDRLAYRLTDEGVGLELAAETLDASAIEERYGGSVLAPEHARVFGLAGTGGPRPVGPIILAGDVGGRDERGNAVQTPFRLTAPSLIVHDPVPGANGACQAGPRAARGGDHRGLPRPPRLPRFAGAAPF